MVAELSLITGYPLRRAFALLLLVLSSMSFCDAQGNTPHILLIAADDLAYTDISSYGGEIDTPHLDELATNGIRFTQFHTAPYCAVTRAMVLTGNNNHVAGMGSQDLSTTVKGYEGQLSNRVVTIPQLLKTKGYSTFMAGKWHLGTSKEANPHEKGFDHSFVMLEGAANHYNDVGVLREPAISPYTEDGQPVHWPEGKYSTDHYTDQLLQHITQAHKRSKPFFGFAAYTSPHWPLQVDEKHWKKYSGQYNGGYDSLRVVRFERAKNAGIIDQNTTLPDRHPDVIPWRDLTPEEQKIEARKMELYAGMVDNLDFNIGRLIGKLKELGIYENTLIIFMSDNGAAAEDFVKHPYFEPYIKAHFNNDYENMGQPDSYVSYGKQWAEAGSAPFKYFKGFTTEGGMTAPLIISGYSVNYRDRLEKNFITLMDIAPTIYEIAGIDYPAVYNGHEIKEMKGESLLSLFSDPDSIIHDEDYVFAIEHRGYAMLRKGDWKILNISRPFDPSNFELYRLSSDPGEQENLKDKYPDRYNDLLSEWDRFYKEVGIITPTPSSSEH
jgi:arylsulfatase A-like enzyme